MFLLFRRAVLGLFVLVAGLFVTQVTAQSLTPWYAGGWPLTNAWSSIPGYGTSPYKYPFMNRYPGYSLSGGNPVAGYRGASPRSFLHQRPSLPGGPYGYVQGWVTPQGDFEGTMVIRGNMRKLMGNYYKNRLYNYYLNNY